MKQATIMLTVLGTFLTGSLNARAESGNPFGFETNKHPLEYEYCKKEPGLARGHGYKCNSAPRSHPDLGVYELQFVEEIGLCFIRAKVHGFKMFKSQIAKKYGPPTPRNIKQEAERSIQSIRQNLKDLENIPPELRSTQQRGRILELRDKLQHELDALSRLNETGQVEPNTTQNIKQDIQFIRQALGGLESIRPELRSTWDRGRILELRDELQYKLDALNRLNETGQVEPNADSFKRPGKAIYYYDWSPETGFGGLGDVKKIELKFDITKSFMTVSFWLVPFNTCLKKIDEKADRAF